MSDRPILFSAPMVRALLEGRKTQTRRVLKPQPAEYTPRVIDISKPFFCEEEAAWGQVETIWSRGAVWEPERQEWRSLRGIRFSIGDCLYVRETLERANGEAIGYPADGTWLPNTPWVWKRERLSSIHMPRWASRLTLIVTDVRVQRLQDISEADAAAEGVDRDSDGWHDYLMPSTQCCSSSRESYRTLWEHLHGAGAWDGNPWVAAYTFDVHRCNIDQIYPQLPDWDDILGLAPDATGDLSSEAFVRELRDGWR